MNWTKFLLIAMLFFSCKDMPGREAERSATAEPKDPPALIEADELAKEMEQNPDVVLIDFRKKEKYFEGHLPQAIPMWRSDIENSDYEYGGMMASMEQIETLFSTWGIQNTNSLVVYDDRGSCDAARLWWVLSYYGFYRVRLLNGGLQAWENYGGALTKDTVRRQPSLFRFKGPVDRSKYAQSESLLHVVKNKGNWIVLDTRTPDEFSGKHLKNGAKRAGRIPGSILIDWSGTVRLNHDMKFKDKKTLEALYKPYLPSKSDTIVTYCHTGVRSAHTTFVLTQILGYKNVKNYDGSWTAWSHHENYPIEKDSITSIFQ